MIKYFLLLILLQITACANETAPKSDTPKVQIAYPKNGQSFKRGDTVNLQMKGDFDSVHLLEYAEKKQHLTNGLTLNTKDLGEKNYEIKIFHQGKVQRKSLRISVHAGQSSEKIGYQLLAKYPKNKENYTQGLFFHQGKLYESTGQYGKSKLLRYALAEKSLKLEKEIALSASYFGEGIAMANGQVFQLTWLENTAFVYDPNTFMQTKTLSYPYEGWGLCYKEPHLIMSDGSNRLFFLRTEDFVVEKILYIYGGNFPIDELNELVYAKGYIWANRYQYDEIYAIDPANGEVRFVIDVKNLKNDLDKTKIDVLNGIAYRTETDTFWLTGKLWSHYFEVKIDIPQHTKK